MSYWYTNDVSSLFFQRKQQQIIDYSRYLELFLGQFYRCGNITLWGRIAPSMKGIGIASFLIVTAVTLYYTTIIGIRLIDHKKKKTFCC
jgi:glucose uptake protein GlcU